MHDVQCVSVNRQVKQAIGQTQVHGSLGDGLSQVVDRLLHIGRPPLQWHPAVDVERLIRSG